MPIKLHEIQAETRSIDVEYLGHDLRIDYRPGMVTPEYESRLNAAMQANRPSAGLAEELARIVSGWDVLDEDDKPLPVNGENMAIMPMGLLRVIVEGIAADLAPNASSAGS